jgi:hypothetical protein
MANIAQDVKREQRSPEAFIANRTRHAAKSLDAAIDLLEQSYRCLIEEARDIREETNRVITLRNKLLDVIGAEDNAKEIEERLEDTPPEEPEVREVRED